MAITIQEAVGKIKSAIDAKADASAVPSDVSQLNNDSGYLDRMNGLTSLFPEFEYIDFEPGVTVYVNQIVRHEGKYYKCTGNPDGIYCRYEDGINPRMYDEYLPELVDAFDIRNDKLVSLIEQVAVPPLPVDEIIASREWVIDQGYLTSVPDDYYTKSETSSATEIKEAIANAGKVKTVNGNEPDENGDIQIQAGGGAYALVDVELTEEADRRSCTVQNCTVSRIVVDDSTKPVYITLPAQIPGGIARDLLLRIEVTCAEAPPFAFVAPDDETVEYECVENDWAILQPGINILSFTETKRD